VPLKEKLKKLKSPTPDKAISNPANQVLEPRSSRMSQSDDVRSYLTAKYVAAGLLDKAGNKTTQPDMFDPYNYPADGHIAYCSQCQNDFDAFRKTNMSKAAKPIAEFEHSPACLWYEFFIRKVKQMCPNVQIKRKN
jgi:hypothetical protein